MRLHYFVMIAEDIKYYGEDTLKWWQKLFFRPKRLFIGEKRVTRNKALDVEPVPHFQFGRTFNVLSYTKSVKRVRKIK